MIFLARFAIQLRNMKLMQRARLFRNR